MFVVFSLPPQIRRHAKHTVISSILLKGLGLSYLSYLFPLFVSWIPHPFDMWRFAIHLFSQIRFGPRLFVSPIHFFTSCKILFFLSFVCILLFFSLLWKGSPYPWLFTSFCSKPFIWYNAGGLSVICITCESLTPASFYYSKAPFGSVSSLLCCCVLSALVSPTIQGRYLFLTPLLHATHLWEVVLVSLPGFSFLDPFVNLHFFPCWSSFLFPADCSALPTFGVFFLGTPFLWVLFFLGRKPHVSNFPAMFNFFWGCLTPP